MDNELVVRKGNWNEYVRYTGLKRNLGRWEGSGEDDRRKKQEY